MYFAPGIFNVVYNLKHHVYQGRTQSNKNIRNTDQV